MRKLIPCVVAAAAFVILGAAAGVGVVSAQQQGVFKSGARTVPMYVTVVDNTNRLVPDLKKEDFEILDNGIVQPTTLFDNQYQKITVVVMLDTSGSMTMNLEFLKEGAEQFVLRMLPEDKARIGSFSDKIIITPPLFSNNRDTLIRALHEDIQFGNPTALWDAVDRSMDAMDGLDGRRVVLVFTDGDDNDSRKSLKEVQQRAVENEYMIYAIGLQSHIQGITTKPDKGLPKIASETGGGYFELKATADLNSTFTRVANELHSQYLLGFSPEKFDGKLHKLEVRVKQPNTTARARKSYIANP